MSLHRDFFDIPVYRLSETEYDQEWGNWKSNGSLQKNKEFYEKNPHYLAMATETIFKNFGGNWKYNEIIGYIKLYIFGTQIRGAYFSSDKKICKTRRKLFVHVTDKLSPEINLDKEADNQIIFENVLLYLKECEKKLNKNRPRKKRYIDSSLLETCGPYIDWRRLIDDI